MFCGFLAEYQLEYTIEHQREKEYAKLLLNDLRSDSSSVILYMQAMLLTQK